MVNGSLLIDLFSAYLTRDTELLGKMDPYVQWTLNAQPQTIQRSSTQDNAGKMPVFKEAFVLRCSVGDTLKFDVYDEERGGKDDLIGSGTWQVMNKKEKETMALALDYKSAGVGKIDVAV